MFRQQQIVLEHLASLQSLLERYQRPAQWLQELEENSRHFVVRLPLVGGFSSGKSTLLNALIKTPLFATSIDPQTAVPAELSYETQACFEGRYPDGRVISLSQEAIRNNQLECLQPDGWVDVKFPAPALAAVPHLRLVDMPGWESGVERHAQAIDGYASRSLAYAVVVSAEEGNLRESIRKALRELVQLDMPIIAIISKCDKKLPSDIAEVSATVAKEIEGVTGQAPLAIVKVSARKSEISEFVEALQQLELNAEPLFTRAVVTPFIQQLHQLDRYLDTLANRDDLDSEQIKVKCDDVNAELKQLEERVAQEALQLEGQLEPILNRIRQHVQTRLNEQVDSFTSSALCGVDLDSDMATTIRLAVTEGIKQDFEPAISRFVNNVNAELPADFLLNINSSSLSTSSAKEPKANAGSFTDLLLLVSPLISKIPKIMIVLPVLSILAKLLDGLFSNHQREIAEAEQRESVRRSIQGRVIPQAVEQTTQFLQPLLAAQLTEAKAQILTQVRAQQQSLLDALHQLEQQLKLEEQAFKSQRMSVLADQQQVRQMIERLETRA